MSSNSSQVSIECPNNKIWTENEIKREFNGMNIPPADNKYTVCNVKLKKKIDFCIVVINMEKKQIHVDCNLDLENSVDFGQEVSYPVLLRATQRHNWSGFKMQDAPYNIFWNHRVLQYEHMFQFCQNCLIMTEHKLPHACGSNCSHMVVRMAKNIVRRLLAEWELSDHCISNIEVHIYNDFDDEEN